MKLIKNVSPTGIKVSISVVKPDGQNLTVELNHGDYILTNDLGADTKSIIIQQRKGNISVSDSNSETLTPYEVYHLSSTNIVSQEIILEDKSIDEPVVEQEISINEKIVEETQTEHSLLETVTTESETVTVDPPKNKGGRPKGSFKKKGPGRPKGKKKKKTSSK